MGTRRIVWIDGDTPGAELIEAARSVFDALGVAPVEHERGRIGWNEWLETGESVAPETLALCREAEGIVIGAISRGPDDGDIKKLQGRLATLDEGVDPDPLLTLRRALDLDIQLTEWPASAEEIASPATHRAIYTPEPVAGPCRTALIRAFDRAAADPTRTVTIVTGRDDSVLRPGLLRREARQISLEHPEVQLRETDAFTVCSALLGRPGSSGVLVCDPDVSAPITAVAALEAGGPRLVATSFCAESRGCFTSLERSTRAFAGQGRSNPAASFHAVRMLLTFLREKSASERLDAALSALANEGPRTLDRGGDASCRDVTQFVLSRL